MGKATPRSLWDSRQSCVALWLLSSRVIFPPVRAWPHYHLPGNRRRCSAPFWLKAALLLQATHSVSLTRCLRHGHSSHVQKFCLFHPRYHPWCVDWWFPNTTNKTPISFLKVFLRAWLLKNPTMREPQLDSWSGSAVCWRWNRLPIPVFFGFPGVSAGKESAAVWET